MTEWVSPEEGVIDARKDVSGQLLVLRARDVKRNAYGLSAKVIVAIGGAGGKASVVTSDVLNLDKEESRHSFANVVYGTSGARGRKGKMPESFAALYPRETFEDDLLEFSEQFYKQLLGNLKGGFVNGDTEKSEPSFYMDGYVLTEGGTIWYAPPKSAKSYTLMLVTVAIDAGIPLMGIRVNQTRAMYLNLERGEKGMLRRLGLVNRVLGLPADRPLLMLNRRGRTLADVYDVAKEMVAEHKVGHVALDSLTRGGFGNLNDNEDSNKSMDYLNRLSPSWSAIGHTSRADDTHIFGSIMFDAAMDIGVNVRSKHGADGTLGVGLYVKETNDTGVPPVRIWAYEFDRYGLVGIRDAEPGEFPEVEGDSPAPPRTPWQRIEDHFRMSGRSLSVSRIAADLGMNKGTIDREIKDALAREDIQYMGKVGREMLYSLNGTGRLQGNVAATLGTTHHPPKGGVSPATFENNLGDGDDDDQPY